MLLLWLNLYLLDITKAPFVLTRFFAPVTCLSNTFSFNINETKLLFYFVALTLSPRLNTNTIGKVSQF